ncbi:hypothetical protein GRJ2_001480200 [Grus japonensis]|uniref:Uncharacterized protein n=1 Tax=Grus japonensis TaxID=30415 RepID=A0ABC9WZC9_GRUJA
MPIQITVCGPRTCAGDTVARQNAPNLGRILKHRSMTLLSIVNPLKQREDSLIQKTHFASEFLEANALELYEKKCGDKRIFAKEPFTF